MLPNALNENPNAFPRCIKVFTTLLCLVWQAGCFHTTPYDASSRMEVDSNWALLIYVADEIKSLDIRTGILTPVVTSGMAKIASPGMASFSPTAAQITFKERTEGRKDSLVVFDLNARDQQLLLEMPFLDGPRWSPDGGTIAFSGRSINSGAYDLYAYGLDNKKLATLIQGDLKDGEMVFSWAPDANHIVYQSADNIIYDFDLAKRQSSKIDSGWFPTWSPSGEYIAYRADGPNDPGYVIYDLRTRAKRRILQGLSVYRSLIWSPDSRLLVYAADGRAEFYGDLFIFDLRTKKSTRVLRLEQSVYPTDWRKRGSTSAAALPISSKHAPFRQRNLQVVDGTSICPMSALQ